MTGKPTGSERTRREIATAGAGAALALAAAGLFGSSTVVAQQASPMASPVAGDGQVGQYVVIRLRQLKADLSVEEVMGTIRDGFLPLIQAIPGFISYIGIADPASPRTAFVGVYADKAGADESNRVAAEWLEENGYDWFEGEPDIAEGVIDIAAKSTA